MSFKTQLLPPSNVCSAECPQHFWFHSCGNTLCWAVPFPNETVPGLMQEGRGLSLWLPRMGDQGERPVVSSHQYSEGWLSPRTRVLVEGQVLFAFWCRGWFGALTGGGAGLSPLSPQSAAAVLSGCCCWHRTARGPLPLLVHRLFCLCPLSPQPCRKVETEGTGAGDWATFN